MKWYWQLVIALIAPLITGSILAYNSEALRKLGTKVEVYADFYAGPWFTYPGDKVGKDRLAGNAFNSDLQSLVDARFPFGRLEIRNERNETLTGIRLQFKKGDPVTQYFDVSVLDAGRATKRTDYKDQSAIPIADLAPGETSVVFLFSIHNLSSEYILRDLVIYTSAGKVFPVRHFYDEAEEGEQSTVGKALDLIPYALIVIGVLLLLLLIGLAATFESYYKKLLRSEDFYLAERLRYDSDPKKFSPDLEEKKKT